ncbi:MAG: hypothetical protein FJ387_30655 [Verrucomicrobia bacterium]|nr:hypothetical protein [Verrucomicrobiota bacterium]
MKTVTVTVAQPELRKLVEEAFGGTAVVLAYGEKRVKLERYIPVSGAVDFDLEADSAELEAELLKGVRGIFTPYSRQDLDAIVERVRAEKASR